MPCYFPLNAYRVRVPGTDKVQISFNERDSNFAIKSRQRLALPCGQCVGCRLERSRQWAVRCMHEASLHADNSFLTLTYDDAHLPKDGSLVLSDFQNFVKRLRKSLAPKRVRFYHCGEYGESNNRPHYHALLFGHDFSDKKFFSSKSDNVISTSDELSSLWPHGFSVVGSVSFESAAYVARYVMKKVTGEEADFHYQGRKPEYTTMSRRPGIGAGWFAKYAGDVYPRGGVVVNGKVTRPPRFYDNLLAKYDRSTLELLKIKREEDARHFVDDWLSDGTHIRVDDSSPSRLIVKEQVKQAEIQTLRRSL